MERRALVLLVALAMLPTVVQVTASDAAPSHPASIAALPWYPGYRYTYVDAAGDMIRTVVAGVGPPPAFLGSGTVVSLLTMTKEAHRTILDTEYIDATTHLVRGRSRVTYASDSVARAAIGYSPPADLLGYPLYPGKNWTVNVTQHESWNITTYSDPKHPQTGHARQPYRASFHVGNWTTIPTPAGNLSALPVTFTPLDQVSRAQGLSVVSYVSPHLRLYARIDRNEGGYTPWQRYNLTTYVDNIAPTVDLRIPSTTVLRGEPLNLSAWGSYDVDDGVAAVAWGFGDGNASTAWNVSHVYRQPGTYQLNLTITDHRNLTSTAVRYIHVLDRRPVPVIVAPDHVDPGVPFNVSGAASHDPDGVVVNWTWTFGDGTHAYGANATHAYPEDGAYPVQLTVTDDSGSRSSARVTVVSGNATYTRTPVNVTIQHPADGSRVWGRVPLTWNVTGHVSVVFVTVDGTTVWNGGPETTSYNWNATRAGAGVHHLSVGAIDARGGVHRASVAVTAAVPPPRPPPAVVPPTKPPAGGALATNASTSNASDVGNGSLPGHASNPVPLPLWTPLAALLVAVLLGRSSRHKV